MHIVHAVLLACLAAVPVAAQPAKPTQTRLHIRITGVPTYDIPGVISIGANRMSGRPITAVTHEMIRFTRKDGEPPISIPRPGKRVAGRAVAIDDDLLELVSDYNRERSLIPLDAILKIERGQTRMERSRATEMGVAAGAGALGATYLAAVLLCNDSSNRDCSALRTIFAVAPPSAGALTGWMLGRTHWTAMTADQLRTELMRRP